MAMVLSSMIVFHVLCSMIDVHVAVLTIGVKVKNCDNFSMVDQLLCCA